MSSGQSGAGFTPKSSRSASGQALKGTWCVQENSMLHPLTSPLGAWGECAKRYGPVAFSRPGCGGLV